MAIVIAVIVVSAAAAYKLIDDKTIEENALEALQNTLKRDVSIDGDFTLTRSLHPTLQTSGVSIASADWDQGNYLLKAEQLEFGIALIDLLRGVITIENIVFKNAVINIKRNQQGHSNLEFTQNQSNNTEKKSANPSALLDVVDVEIENLQFNYSDQQNDNSFVYSLDSFKLHPKNKTIIQIKASSRFEDQPVALTSEMCRIRHLLKGSDCTLSATIDATPYNSDINGTINIADNGKLDLSIKAVADDITDFLLTKELPLPNTEKANVSMHLNGKFNQITASDIELNIALKDTDINAQGNVNSINTLSGVNVSLDASGSQPEWLNSYQEVFPAELINQFKVLSTIESDGSHWKIHSLNSSLEIDDSKILTTGEILVTDESAQVAISIDAKGNHPSWLNELQQAIAAEHIDEFSVKANISNPDNIFTIDSLESSVIIEDITTTAQGSITINQENTPSANLSLTSEGKNLQSFEKVIRQSLPVSNNFSLNSKLNYESDLLSLIDLNLTVDNTELAGNSDIEFVSPPNVRANLSAESLNIEHLLATIQAEEKEQAEKQEKTSLFSDEKIDLNWLKSANTEISLLINNLIYKEAVLNDVKANIAAKNNIASVDIESLNYRDANLRAKALIDGNKNIFTHSLHTEEFNLGQLLSDIDASETLQGKIDASIDINSYGTTSQQLANNANGKITAVMTEGSLADAPIDLLASNLLVELMPGKSKKDNTSIECLFVQFSGSEGVFNSDAALLNTENIVMTTNGSVDLSKEKLNLLLIPKPKDIELFTLDANIRVSGDISDPSFSLDKGSVFKKLLKSAATVALGPAALAIPFASMGNKKSEKCFSEVASTTTKAVEAQQEAERIAAEKLAEEEAQRAEEKILKEANVEPLDP